VLNRLESLARQVPVRYPAGPRICRHYAEQATRLKDAGTPIGANDLWIACHALAEDATVVTHNVREFTRVSDLRVEDWSETPPDL
jgi:tRNA(fMet)-specific endonuclease VapC